MKQEISKGQKPIRAGYDLRKGVFVFRLDGKTVEFPYMLMPFTLNNGYADEALVRKYAKHD